jgi:hypothetical protein
MLSRSPAVSGACHAAPTDNPSKTPRFQACSGRAARPIRHSASSRVGPARRVARRNFEGLPFARLAGRGLLTCASVGLPLRVLERIRKCGVAGTGWGDRR